MTIIKTTRDVLEAWLSPALRAAYLANAQVFPALNTVKIAVSGRTARAYATDRFKAVCSTLNPTDSHDAKVSTVSATVSATDLRAALAVLKAGRPPRSAEVVLSITEKRVKVTQGERSVTCPVVPFEPPAIAQLLEIARDGRCQTEKMAFSPALLHAITMGWTGNLVIEPTRMSGGEAKALYITSDPEDGPTAVEWVVMGRRS